MVIETVRALKIGIYNLCGCVIEENKQFDGVDDIASENQLEVVK